MRVCNNSEIFARHNGLYYVWIRGGEAPNSPLVAVWIDPSMQAFEDGLKPGSPVNTPREAVSADESQPEEAQLEHLEEDGPAARAA